MRQLSAIALLTLVGAASAQADPIAYWRFPAAVAPGAQNFWITMPLAADTQANPGAAQITTDATVWNGVANPANDVGQGTFQYFAGSTIGALNGDAAGQGLSFRALTGLLGNGKSMTFQVSTLGFSDIMLDYAERTTTTGASSIAVSTSTDGVNFTPATTLTTTRDATFRARNVDLSAVNSIENVASAYIRLTFTGFSNASGAVRFDNIVISGTVPTPGAAGLMGLAGLAALRRRRA